MTEELQSEVTPAASSLTSPADESQPTLPDQVPIDSQASVTVKENGKWAELILSEPQFDGKPISKEAIQTALAEAGVTYGINEEELNLLAIRPSYGEPIVIAVEKPAICGEDGYLRYLFTTDHSLTPTETNDGLVDYRNLNFIQNIDKDQKLAEIIPPTDGTPGYNVYGQIIEAVAGKPVTDANGDNTYLSEDGSAIFASCSGSPMQKKQQVCVSRVITVDNVDISTGNLLYVGTIVVKGNVCDGFTISASEGITIRGTVENAKLISGGDISVGQGISGLKSKVVAGGNIRSGFLENCIVEAKGDIYADAILHADIKCHGKVVVKGRRGCIIGGVCRAARSISAQVIGNEKYIPTSVEIFGTYLLEQKADELKTKIQAQQEEVAKADQLLTQLMAIESVSAQLKDNAQLTKDKHQEKLTKLELELQALTEQIESFDEAQVHVERRMYENVMVIINNIKEENELIRGRCTAYCADGAIAYR